MVIPSRDNLPTRPDLHIGRERDVEAARDRLLDADACLLTLTGPGGTGKTRLALPVASAVIEQFEHGACFVDLAPFATPRWSAPRSLGRSGCVGQPASRCSSD